MIAIWPLPGIPEIEHGHDLTAEILAACRRADLEARRKAEEERNRLAEEKKRQEEKKRLSQKDQVNLIVRLQMYQRLKIN